MARNIQNVGHKWNRPDIRIPETEEERELMIKKALDVMDKLSRGEVESLNAPGAFEKQDFEALEYFIQLSDHEWLNQKDW